MVRNNMRSNDRILVLQKDKDADLGLIDPGIFEGKNNLHVVMDPNTLIWNFKYERGPVPPALRNRYTSFKLAKEAADTYFKTKNVKVVAVRD
jgi:hypothetical protein